jgi:mannose-6-phosphate isomerase-like protein (cupin superfamily)
MPVVLDGGCRVTMLREGEPQVEGALRVWNHFDQTTGTRAITLRVLELAEGEAATLRNDGFDEVLYVVSGSGEVMDGAVAADQGIYLPSGSTLTLHAEETMTLIGSRCPADPAASLPPSVVSMHERPVERTGDRWYREIITAQVTQFVGSIPPGRAPDHFHLYEEVLCVLQGEGVMWAGQSHTPIAAGSCVFLPIRQVHCVENTGTGELRLLGVFYPAGSPAVRYAAP